MAVHAGLRIVELGTPNRDHGATRIVPLVTEDAQGFRRDWQGHAMMPGTADRLREGATVTFYATDVAFMKVLNGIRIDGETGHFESRMATIRMLAIGCFATLFLLVLAPLLIFLPLLFIAVLVLAAAISANRMRWRFRRDERSIAVRGRYLPDP